MTLKIEFSTDGDQPGREAGALMALLLTLYPNASDEALAALNRESGPVINQHIDLSIADLDRMAAAQRAADAPVLSPFKAAGLEAGRAYDPTPDIGPEPVTTPGAAMTAIMENPPEGFVYVAPGAPTPALTAEQAFGAPVPQPPADASAVSATEPASASAQPAPAAPATGAAATTPAPSPAASSVERDAEGLPWHADIHSSNHKRSNDGKGNWMKRRGVSDETWERVRAALFAENTARTQAELTGSGLLPQPSAAAPAPPPPTAPMPPVAAPPTAASPAIPQPSPSATASATGVNTGNTTAAPTPASPSSAAPPPPVLPRPAATPEKIARFGQMMTRINAAERDGRLPAGHAATCVRSLGLSALVDLMRADDDVFTAFAEMMTAAGA